MCCGFAIYGFYYGEVCSLYACFLESFYHKWVFNFVKGFLSIYWDNHMVFIFQFVNMIYHIVWFMNIEGSLHPWNKAHLIILYDLFKMLLDSVCQNFVENFYIYVQQWYWPVFFFFVGGTFVWFWYQDDLASYNEFGSFPSCEFSGRVWVG